MLQFLQKLTDAAEIYLTVRIGEFAFAPQYTLILVAALAVALVSALNLWRIGRREDRQRQLEALRSAVTEQSDQARTAKPRWYQRLGALVATSPVVGRAEQQRLIDALAAAGMRQHRSLMLFITIKVCSAIACAVLCFTVAESRGLLPDYMLVKAAILIAGLMLGWRVPEIVLSQMASRRRLKIEQGLPDALDLLVICAEAGLSLDQAIEEVAGHLGSANPAVSEEFSLTAAEMRVLADRTQALQNLVKRTGVANLYGVVATLTQALRFGTPLAESMRIIANELRNARLARIEERAARLPVLLAIPLMAFMLPALFMVLGTPVALRLMDFISNVSVPSTLSGTL
jgi:tight adherence protein C